MSRWLDSDDSGPAAAPYYCVAGAMLKVYMTPRQFHFIAPLEEVACFESLLGCQVSASPS